MPEEQYNGQYSQPTVYRQPTTDVIAICRREIKLEVNSDSTYILCTPARKAT